MEDLSEWMPQEKVEISLAQMDEAVAEVRKLRKEYEEKKALVSEVNSRLEEAEGKIIKMLEASGKTKYEAEGVGLVSVSIRESYKTPKTVEDKTKLFNWIKETHGPEALMGLVSINSQTLNSFAKKEIENNPGLNIPGLEVPSVSTVLSFRDKSTKE